MLLSAREVAGDLVRSMSSCAFRLMLLCISVLALDCFSTFSYMCIRFLRSVRFYASVAAATSFGAVNKLAWLPRTFALAFKIMAFMRVVRLVCSVAYQYQYIPFC